MKTTGLMTGTISASMTVSNVHGTLYMCNKRMMIHYWSFFYLRATM